MASSKSAPTPPPPPPASSKGETTDDTTSKNDDAKDSGSAGKAKTEAIAKPKVEPARAVSTNGGTWRAPTDVTREQLGVTVAGTWIGRHEGNRVVVKHGCPVLGLPRPILEAMKRDKQPVERPPKPPEPETIDEFDVAGS